MSGAMDELFDRFALAFAEGHRAEIPDLLTDAHLAEDGRATPAAVGVQRCL